MANVYTGGSGYPEHPLAPSPVRRAARLMYLAGALTAAATCIEALLTLVFGLRDHVPVGPGDIPKSALPPGASAANFHPAGFVLGTLIPTIILMMVIAAIGLGVAALWFLLGRRCRAGRPWARTVATLVFAVYSFFLLVFLVTSGVTTAASPAVVYPLVPWLFGLGTITLLWQRQSSAYFRTTPS
jgi:hypothetical protein